MAHILKKKNERKKETRKERKTERKEGRKEASRPARGCLSAAGKITAPPLHTDEEIPTRPEEALQRCPQGHSQGLWAQVLPSYFFLRYLTQPFTSLHPHLLTCKLGVVTEATSLGGCECPVK